MVIHPIMEIHTMGKEDPEVNIDDHPNMCVIQLLTMTDCKTTIKPP